jgi:hypothetical protein
VRATNAVLALSTFSQPGARPDSNSSRIASLMARK